MEKFKENDSRINVIHQTNQGPLIARQIGISVAVGHYILFLDSDDYYDNNLLVTVSKYSKNNYDIILFRWHYRTKNNLCRDSKTLFAHEMVFTNENMKILYMQLLKTNDINSLCVKAVKRSLFSCQFNIDEYHGIKNGEDLLQTIPLFMNAKSIIYLDIPLYNYVKNEDGITHNFSASYFQSMKLISKVLEENLCECGIDSKGNRSIIDKRFLLSVVNGMPKPDQIKKIGLKKAKYYLCKIACDEMFRRKYEMCRINGFRIFDHIQLFMLYHKHYYGVIAFGKLRTLISRIKQKFIVSLIRQTKII